MLKEPGVDSSFGIKGEALPSAAIDSIQDENVRKFNSVAITTTLAAEHEAANTNQIMLEGVKLKFFIPSEN